MRIEVCDRNFRPVAYKSQIHAVQLIHKLFGGACYACRDVAFFAVILPNKFDVVAAFPVHYLEANPFPAAIQPLLGHVSVGGGYFKRVVRKPQKCFIHKPIGRDRILFLCVQLFAPARQHNVVEIQSAICAVHGIVNIEIDGYRRFEICIDACGGVSARNGHDAYLIFADRRFYGVRARCFVDSRSVCVCSVKRAHFRVVVERAVRARVRNRAAYRAFLRRRVFKLGYDIDVCCNRRQGYHAVYKVVFALYAVYFKAF